MTLHYSVDDMDLLLRAIWFAEEKHRGQVRKDVERSPYIRHPLTVMGLLWDVGEVRDVGVLAAAVLHDTIEDTEATAEEVAELFGKEIAAVVQELTDDKSLPKRERKRRQVESAPHKSEAAAQVKLADKTCNIRDVVAAPPADWSAEERRAYVEWGAQVVTGLPKVNGKLEAYFQGVLEQARDAV